MSQSEDYFRAVADNAAEAIVTIDDHDRILYANQAAARLFGYSFEELVQLRFSELIPARLRQRHREGIQRYALTARRHIPWDGIALPGLRRDGTEVPLEVTFGEYRSGTERRFTGIMRDISSRQAHEHALRFLSEVGRILSSSLDPHETLRQVAQLAVPRIADWCAIYLLEGDQVRLVEIAHRDPNRLAAARQMRERYPPRPDASVGVYAVLRSRQPQLIPKLSDEMIRASAHDEEHLRLIKELDLGSILTVPLEARGSIIGAVTLVMGASGRSFGDDDLNLAQELAARAGTAVDNARLYAEARRRAGEEMALRQATEAVAASATVEEVIQAIATGARAATGSDGAFVERITEKADELEVVAVHGSNTPKLGARAPLAGSFAEEALRRHQPVRVDDLGQERSPSQNSIEAMCGECSLLVLPLRDESEPIGTLVLVRSKHQGSFSDHETDQAFSFASLAALAFRRLYLLRETVRRQEELEQVSESRARLMRGFSHDVKNPLGAADGNLALLEDGILGSLNPKQRDSVLRSRTAIRSALELINDLLDLARAESSLVRIEPGPMDLAALVRNVADQHRPAAERKGLDLTVESLPETLIIQSDPSRVKQILENLLSNAVKYTDRGGVKLSIETCAPGTDSRSYLCVRVQDSGRGVPPEKRHLLFQEFERISEDQEGVGIGLAISQRLARAIGGEITVESEVGHGSAFSLWLPIDESESGSASEQVA